MSMFNLCWDLTESHVIIQNTYNITYLILFILGGTRIKFIGAR